MKIYCEKCEGDGIQSFGKGECQEAYGICESCKGKGYTAPTQGIVDAIECDRVEKMLIEKYKNKEVVICCEFGIFNIGLPSDLQIPNYFDRRVKKYFEGDTKLDALKKALKWIEDDHKRL